MRPKEEVDIQTIPIDTTSSPLLDTIEPKQTVKQVAWSKDLYNKLEKCEFIYKDGTRCKCVKMQQSKFCRHHLSTEERQIVESRKRMFAEKKKMLSVVPDGEVEDNKDDDLNFEIRLLKNYLHQLISSTPKKKMLDPNTLRLQLAMIEQIRKLVHSLSAIETQGRIYSTVTKIINSIVDKVVELINKHTTDDNLKALLSSELLNLSNLDSTDKDLSVLLRQLNPRQRVGKFN